MKNRIKLQVLCAAALTVSTVWTGYGSYVTAAQITEVQNTEGETAEEETSEEETSEEETTEDLSTKTESAKRMTSGDVSLQQEETQTEQEEAVTEEVISEPETEGEEQGELVFEPEYHLEQDPNPLVSSRPEYLYQKELEKLKTISIPDTDWIAINGERATCQSYAKICYAYQSDVETGTIRYISQIAGNGLFDWNYWGSWGNQAGIECGTASISMAMSYIGVNLTPAQILDAHGGLTSFTGWGVVDLSPDVESGMQLYINGRGQYSPVIVHLPNYSELGHYVVLIGKLSDSEYLVLDCAQNSTWVMTVGDGYYNAIDQVYQYYNPDGTILDHTEVKDLPKMATCTKMGLTSGTHCQVCGEILQEPTVVPCNGHAWSDWIVTEEPDTTHMGEKKRICQVCQETEIRGIDRLPEELVLEIPEGIWN